jgi:glycosyltransferase involved in cell wall biosynthesis
MGTILTSIERQRSVTVSVIIPVYNTDEYLPRCLDSVAGQTLEDIEIIAVDDGSTDRSAGVLQRYAREDPRIRVVRHERNEGLHIARISGVLASSGRFLGYVDSDDYVAPDMFERMYRSAVDRASDVVRMGAWLMREAEPRLLPNDHSAKGLSFSDRAYPAGIDYLDADFHPSMCLHLHDRRLWDMALPHFPRVRLIGEDNLTSFVLAFFAGRVISLPDRGYFYVERDDSLSGSQSLPSVARHITDRGTIVVLLSDFVAAAGGKAERCWRRLKSDNRGLLFSYIGGLESRADRLAAMTLFETSWGEPVPADLKSAWSAN